MFMQFMRSVVANSHTGCKAHWYSTSMKEALSDNPKRIKSLINGLGNGVPSVTESHLKTEQLEVRTPNNDFINWRDNLSADIHKLEVYLVRFD